MPLTEPENQQCCDGDDLDIRRQLGDALREAKKAMEDRDEFLSVAAHELRTPLTTIIGFTQLLGSYILDRLNDREAKMLRTILVQQGRLNGMITAMLDMTRIERGSLRLNPSTLDVVTLTRGIIDEMQIVADNHTFITDYPDDCVFVSGDQDRLEQVLRNVLSNAIKYSPNGGTIQVSVRLLFDQTTITITDTGMGIPPNELSSIFEQYKRGSNLDGSNLTRISGMGIGLYISREIIHMHNGAIYASSAGRGQGSTFTIVLPLRKSHVIAA